MENRACKEPVARTRYRHRQISQDEETLRYRHIMIPVRLRIKEIQHHRRSLHPEKPAKNTA